MEYVEGISQSLLSLHRLGQHDRVCRLGRRVLQCFRVLDLGYFVAGLALTVSAADYDISSHLENVLFGVSLLLFSFLSALCNLMALRGISTWNRRYLIPWLAFYPLVIVFLVFSVFHTLWITDFHLELYQVFILLIVSGISTCWKHVYRVFKLLGCAELDESSESERTYPEYGSMSRTAAEDLPPKYEDVQQCPPQYEMPPDYDEAVGCRSHDKITQQIERN